jgi:porin
MAIGVTFGERLSGRHRFGGGGGWRLARFGAACLMALLAVANGALAQQAPDTAANPKPFEKVVSVSGNPAATDVGITGTGWLGRTLGLKDEWGVKLGGMWLADTNVLVAGGAQPGGWTNNQALVLGLNVQAEKLVGWRGASFGVQFLQFNGGETNEQAGSIAGYNSIVSLPPLNRTELLEAWYRQEMVPDVLSMRIGRSMPSYDFGNVSRPIALADPDQNIPAVTALLFSPVFVNPSMIGAMMGFYNPGNGVTVNFTPTKSFYVNLGVYDGNRARGVQTGINPPMFNGYWFNIGEVGVNWLLGEGNHPGQFAVGIWRQTGILSFGGVTEDGTGGFYLFGSQRVAYGVNPSVHNSSISVFYQLGANASRTLPMSQYYGGGITGFGLIGSRASDSMGFGVGLSKMNPNLFQRPYELMFQAYYQAHLFASVFLQPTISYIPTPGLSPTLPGALATTLRLTVLF